MGGQQQDVQNRTVMAVLGPARTCNRGSGQTVAEAPLVAGARIIERCEIAGYGIAAAAK